MLFVSVGNCSKLGSSGWWRFWFMDMTPCWCLIRSWIQQSRCFKGCIFGFSPGGTINSIFYNNSFVYPTSWQQCWMLQSRCFKGCISRCAVKSSSVWEATHPFTSGLPPGGTLYSVFYDTSFVYPTCWFWLQTVISESRCIGLNIACTVSMVYDIFCLMLLPSSLCWHIIFTLHYYVKTVQYCTLQYLRINK